jgi:archaeosine-15-forming tRNA-guanine transglycosylase
MGKTIFLRCLAAIGIAVCGYVTATAYGASRYHQQLEARLTQWCAAQAGCVRVRFESSLREPLVKVQMRPIRQGYKAEDLLAHMRRSGVFEVDGELKGRLLKMPEPRLRVIVAAS